MLVYAIIAVFVTICVIVAWFLYQKSRSDSGASTNAIISVTPNVITTQPQESAASTGGPVVIPIVVPPTTNSGVVLNENVSISDGYEIIYRNIYSDQNVILVKSSSGMSAGGHSLSGNGGPSDHIVTFSNGMPPVGWTKIARVGLELNYWIWRPIAPAGYTSVGDYITNTATAPANSNIVCIPAPIVETVRKTVFVKTGDAPYRIYTNNYGYVRYTTTINGSPTNEQLNAISTVVSAQPTLTIDYARPVAFTTWTVDGRVFTFKRASNGSPLGTAINDVPAYTITQVNDSVVPPVDYKLKFINNVSKADKTYGWGVWEPIPPQNATCLGDVVSKGKPTSGAMCFVNGSVVGPFYKMPKIVVGTTQLEKTYLGGGKQPLGYGWTLYSTNAGTIIGLSAAPPSV